MKNYFKQAAVALVAGVSLSAMTVDTAEAQNYHDRIIQQGVNRAFGDIIGGANQQFRQQQQYELQRQRQLQQLELQRQRQEQQFYLQQRQQEFNADLRMRQQQERAIHGGRPSRSGGSAYDRLYSAPQYGYQAAPARDFSMCSQIVLEGNRPALACPTPSGAAEIVPLPRAAAPGVRR